MAQIKNNSLDLELSGYSSTAGWKSSMPRLDVCSHCGKLHSAHVEGKCLFDASTFTPVDQNFYNFQSQFLAWLNGQKIEDAFAQIVYELTRRD